MGLFSWLRARRSPSPKRPWVRPEFLAIGGVLLGAAFGLAWVMASDGGSPPNDEFSGTQKREYVGLASSEIQGALGGDTLSIAQARYAAWEAQHPDARVSSVEPVYEDGKVVGYWVEYRE